MLISHTCNLYVFHVSPYSHTKIYFPLSIFFWFLLTVKRKSSWFFYIVYCCCLYIIFLLGTRMWHILVFANIHTYMPSYTILIYKHIYEEENCQVYAKSTMKKSMKFYWFNDIKHQPKTAIRWKAKKNSKKMELKNSCEHITLVWAFRIFPYA